MEKIAFPPSDRIPFGIEPSGNIVYPICADHKPLEQWSDIETVAKHIGFSTDSVRRWVKQGKLPAKALKNGSRTYYRFKLSEVDEAINRGWK